MVLFDCDGSLAIGVVDNQVRLLDANVDRPVGGCKPVSYFHVDFVREPSFVVGGVPLGDRTKCRFEIKPHRIPLSPAQEAVAVERILEYAASTVPRVDKGIDSKRPTRWRYRFDLEYWHWATAGVLMRWVLPVAIALLFIEVIVLLAPMHRRRRRASRNLCPHCGYSLQGIDPSTICPECGRDYLVF